MKKIIIIIIILFSVSVTFAQLTMTSGSHLVVNSGSTVVTNDGITATNATITNNGTIENKGDLVNNTSGLFASGSSGTFVFNGSSAQEITGDTDADFYGTLEIDNSTGISITSTSTGNDQTVNGTLTFTNGLLTLNTFNMTIGTTDPTGAGTSKYIKTNNTGIVTRSVPNTGTNITYPVGNSSYNPLILQNSASGTTDNYSVRAVDDEPSGSETTNMVDRSWIVTEATANGSKLTVTTQWNSAEQLTSFDRTNCAVGLTTNSGTTYNWKTYGSASGSDPYTRPGSTFTGIGTFAVGDKDFVADNIIVSDITIANTESDCFNAEDTLNVAGNGSTVLIENGGDATFIAGGIIIFNPGFEAESGSTVDAHITLTSTYCGTLFPSILANIEELEDNPFEEVEHGINIYPNPTTGQFNIDFMGNPYPDAEVYIISFRGEKIHKMNTQNNNKIVVDLSYLPDGIYLVVIKTANKIITKRIVKTI